MPLAISLEVAKIFPSLYLSYLELEQAPFSNFRNLLFQMKDAPESRWLADEFPNLERAIDLAVQKANAADTALQRWGIEVYSYWSSKYPECLRSLSPPVNLFVRGRIPKMAALGVVGTRKPNQYGIDVLQNIFPKIAKSPLQVVSGLARGIDSMAHETSLACGFPNVAVLGCGLDSIYPRENEKLADTILNREGALVSEWPPGTPARSFHFPRRNRLIAALSDVVWVVQGSMLSGARHTVKYALDLSREVVATPGDIFFELSEYPNSLIRDGAGIVASADDIDQLFEKTTPLFDSLRRLVHL